MRIPVVENTDRSAVSVAPRRLTAISDSTDGISATNERYIAPNSVILLDIFFR